VTTVPVVSQPSQLNAYEPGGFVSAGQLFCECEHPTNASAENKTADFIRSSPSSQETSDPRHFAEID
jgi:hypothetical protein